MKLKGTHTIQAPIQKVWEMLMDPTVLAKITPGVSKLELTGEDEYDAIANMKIGPVSGSFKGALQIVDKDEPNQFTLKTQQKSKIGNAKADVVISLEKIDAQTTEVSFNGKAQLSGTIARTGQRVVSGVANSLSKQFFEALNEEVQAQTPEPEPDIEEEPAQTESIQQLTTSSHSTAAPSNENLSFFGRIMAWLKGLFN